MGGVLVHEGCYHRKLRRPMSGQFIVERIWTNGQRILMKVCIVVGGFFTWHAASMSGQWECMQKIESRHHPQNFPFPWGYGPFLMHCSLGSHRSTIPIDVTIGSDASMTNTHT